MSSEIVVDGKTYVSSKEAALKTGYTQDYIGQLARGGSIDARRIAGLWHVSLESLAQYKIKAESYAPVPPQKNSQDVNAFVSFDGKDYVSTTRAAEITGYAPDYVGQLAREGRVLARQVGARWYIARDELIAHKKEKDALLGAVQAESVGLLRSTRVSEIENTEPIPTATPPTKSHFTYIKEAADLIPSLHSLDGNKDEEKLVSAEASQGEEGSFSIEQETHQIPIRVVTPHTSYEEPISEMSYPSREAINILPRSHKKFALSVVASVVVLVIVALPAITYISLRGESSERQVASPDRTIVGVIGSWLEQLLVTELWYKRSE